MDREPLNLSEDVSPAPPPVLDLERYIPQVEAQFDSEEEAIEFLRTLWSIMCAFVDLGWGVDSIHFAFPELAVVQVRTSEAEDS